MHAVVFLCAFFLHQLGISEHVNQTPKVAMSYWLCCDLHTNTHMHYNNHSSLARIKMHLLIAIGDKYHQLYCIALRCISTSINRSLDLHINVE